MSVTDIPIWFYSIPILGAPIGFLFTVILYHRGTISRHDTEIKALQESSKKIDKLCTDIAYIRGKIEKIS